MPLSDDEVSEITTDLWKRHQDELPRLDRIYGYARGKLGRPEVPDGAGDELDDIAKLSIKNVLKHVEESFVQNLSVVGFRDSKATTDAPAWEIWQKQKMDARQAEVHRPAVRYGASYLIVEPGKDGPIFRPRSPRQLFAVYADPQIDQWPIYALETWLDYTEKRPRLLATLYDDSSAYPLDLGQVRRSRSQDGQPAERRRGINVKPLEDDDGKRVKIREHDGGGVCPIVRFVNERDAEDFVVGEIEPLIPSQRAINAVNFDRLVVSRHGAFRQKYLIGYSAKSKDELLKMSASSILAFDDDFVKAGTFDASSVEPYNAILEEMMEHVATTAQIPTRAVTGKIANLSPEAIAAADWMQQRKLSGKRESFGESWEQALGLGAKFAGSEFDDAAEVVWRPTDIAPFSAVVDGITKLAAAGVPLDTLIDDIPTWTQQQKTAAKARLGSTAEITAALDRLANSGSDADGL